MMDLGFSSPKFTWSNKREIGNLITEANVTHLAKINLDHCPLLLKLNLDSRQGSNRPFRF